MALEDLTVDFDQARDRRGRGSSRVRHGGAGKVSCRTDQQLLEPVAACRGGFARACLSRVARLPSQMVGAELVFPGVEAGSGVSGRLLELRRVVVEDPALQAAEVRRSCGRGCGMGWWRSTGSTGRRGGRRRGSRWGSGPGRCSGIGATVGVRVLDFPDEPALTWLREPTGPLWSWGKPSRLRILRYIPLRRVTFLLEGADGAGAAGDRQDQARRRAWSAPPRPCAAPTPPPGGPRRASWWYRDRWASISTAASCCSRRCPASPWDRCSIRPTARRRCAGWAPCTVACHEFEVPGVPVLATADWVDAAAKAAEQIAALVPSVADAVRRLLGRLAATVPPDVPGAFCQGDFVPSQILRDPRGRPCWTSTTGTSPTPTPRSPRSTSRSRASSGCPRARRRRGPRRDLEGCQERAGEALDPDRLRWFLGVAQLRYLARRLVKGRAAPGRGVRDPQPGLDGAAAAGAVRRSAIDPTIAAGCPARSRQSCPRSPRSPSDRTSWWSITPTTCRFADGCGQQVTPAISVDAVRAARPAGEPVDRHRDLAEAAERHGLGGAVASQRRVAQVVQQSRRDRASSGSTAARRSDRRERRTPRASRGGRAAGRAAARLCVRGGGGGVRGGGEQRRDLVRGGRVMVEAFGMPPVGSSSHRGTAARRSRRGCWTSWATRRWPATAPPRALPLGGLREVPVAVDWFARRSRSAERVDRDGRGALLAAAVRDGRAVGVMLHHEVLSEDDLGDLGAALPAPRRAPCGRGRVDGRPPHDACSAAPSTPG